VDEFFAWPPRRQRWYLIKLALLRLGLVCFMLWLFGTSFIDTWDYDMRRNEALIAGRPTIYWFSWWQL
jgi:hypothetical protein